MTPPELARYILTAGLCVLVSYYLLVIREYVQWGRANKKTEGWAALYSGFLFVLVPLVLLLWALEALSGVPIL